MKKHFVASVLVLTLVACSNAIQPTPIVTAIPTMSVAVTPTLVPLLSTETQEAQPVSEWNGIPIMQGALAGEGDEEGYVFTLKATPQQVQEYYQVELGKRGWRPISQEASDSSVLLIFMDITSATLTIHILSKGDEVLVLLVK